MPTVRVDLAERSYDISIGPGSLDSVGAAAGRACRSGTAALVTNPKIGGLYAEQITKSLVSAGLKVTLVTVPAGERYKSLSTCAKLYNEFLHAKLDRGSAVVALGGGVIGDLAGFAAATFLRGINFVQVPTTLLAQVDSSIGGKTGVNLAAGKNLVGAFHQPSAVIIDPLVLRTLPAREMRSGLAEVIKHGIIYDREYFHFLTENIREILSLDPEALTQAIRRSCEIKAGVVTSDERESGLREILNFGHTIGHGVETAAGYGRYRHGEAVAIGMVAEALIAESMGIAQPGVSEEIRRLLLAARLPVSLSSRVDIDDVLSAMSVDKKARQGKISFVLPKEIGAVVRRNDVPPDAILQALKTVQER